jgi:hypothetical protein
MKNPLAQLLVLVLLALPHCATAQQNPAVAPGAASTSAHGCQPSYAYYRNAFDLNAQPVRATLYVAHGRTPYFLSVNGVRAAQSVRNNPGAPETTAWDVSALIIQGLNVVSVFTTHNIDTNSSMGGDCAPAFNPMDVDLVVQTQSGQTTPIASHGTWKTVTQYADEGMFQSVFVYDARQAPPLQTRPVDDYADHAGIFMKYAHWQDADYDDDAWALVSAAEQKTPVANPRYAIDYSQAPGAVPVYEPFKIFVCDPGDGEKTKTAASDRCKGATGAASPDSNGIPIPSSSEAGASQTLRLTVAPPDSPRRSMASFRFFASEAGAEVVIKGLGRYITRQGIQNWDTFLDINEVEIFIEGPGRGIFLLDAGAWRAPE